MKTFCQIMKKYRSRIRKVSIHPGIYFLVKAGEIVYVGQSVHVHVRIHSHINAKDFDEAYYFECDKEDLDEIERILIRALSPKYNVTHNDVATYGENVHDLPRSINTKTQQEIEKRIRAGYYNKRTIKALVDSGFIEEQAARRASKTQGVDREK